MLLALQRQLPIDLDVTDKKFLLNTNTQMPGPTGGAFGAPQAQGRTAPTEDREISWGGPLLHDS